MTQFSCSAGAGLCGLKFNQRSDEASLNLTSDWLVRNVVG